MTATNDRAGCWCATTRVPCEYHQAVEDGRDEERAAIVAYLRKGCVVGLQAHHQAAHIEKGEHRRG